MKPVLNKDGYAQIHSDLKRDDIIYDLESKLKTQQGKIKELNERVDYKQKKIEVLTDNYKSQIEALKKEFNFVGDVNTLLGGGEYTKEAKYTRTIRDAMDNCRIKTTRISELEDKIAELKETIKRIKTEQDLKNADSAMADIYLKIKADKLSEQNIYR